MYDCKYVEKVGTVGVRVTEKCPKRIKIKGQLITAKRMCENCKDYRQKTLMCKECNHCEEHQREDGKTEFYCRHPSRKCVDRSMSKSRKIPGLIGYSKDGEIPVKTSPRWCPRKDDRNRRDKK